MQLEFRLRCRGCSERFTIPLDALARDNKAFIPLADADDPIQVIFESLSSVRCPLCERERSPELLEIGESITVPNSSTEAKSYRDMLTKRVVQLVELDEAEIPDVVADYLEHQKSRESLIEDILDSFVDAPGQLIYVSDYKMREKVRRCIDDIWLNADADDMRDRVYSKRSDILVDLVGDSVENSLAFPPFVVCAEPMEPKVFAALEDSVRAWVFGMHGTATVGAAAVVEVALKTSSVKILNTQLRARKKSGQTGRPRRYEFLNAAVDCRILNEIDKATIDSLWETRDGVVHNLLPVSRADSREHLRQAFGILLKLLIPR